MVAEGTAGPARGDSRGGRRAAGRIGAPARRSAPYPRGSTGGRSDPALERPGGADRRRQPASHDRGGLGPPHVVDVVRAPAGRPVRRPPAHGRRRPAWPRERPVRDVEGPRGAGPVRGAPGGRRDRRRPALVAPADGLARAGPPRAGPRAAVDRRGERLARAGPRRRPRDGPRDADGRRARATPGSCSGTPRWPRGRSGRRWRPPPSTGSGPHRGPRPQPARPARPDDARLAGRRLPRPRRGVRVDRDPDRRARRRRDRRRVPRRRGRRPADPDRSRGPRRATASPSSPIRRDGTARRSRPSGSTRRSTSSAGDRDLRVTPPAPPDWKPVQLGELRAAPGPRLRRTDRHTQGVRRRARLARRAPARPRRARRRGGQLHPHRGRGARRPRAVHPAVHRRAVHGRRRRPGSRRSARPRGRPRSAPSSRAPTTRSAWASISRADLRLCGSHAGVSIGEDGPSQMAVEDLAMFRALHGLDGALPVRRHEHGQARGRDVRPARRLVPADHPRGDVLRCTAPTRRSRSAGRRPSPRDRTTT